MQKSRFCSDFKRFNRYQGYISYVYESKVYFYVVVFSKSMSSYLVQGTLCRNTFMLAVTCVQFILNVVRKKTFHVEGNKVPKANLKCTCRFARLLNLDTVRMMSRTNILTVRHLSLVSRVMLCSACGKRSV